MDGWMISPFVMGIGNAVDPWIVLQHVFRYPKYQPSSYFLPKSFASLMITIETLLFAGPTVARHQSLGFDASIVGA